MVNVHLRAITVDNYLDCLNLQVEPAQQGFVATNAKSLAEAKANPTLVPLAVYDASARGYPTPSVPMRGFAMYELSAGVGFLLRLMIDQRSQRQGYGRATVREVIRRLRLIPDVEMIATSHRRENVAAAALFRSVGFVPWDLTGGDPGEVFLRLPNET